MNRRSKIVSREINLGGDTGITQMHSVLMYEDDKLVENRTLPGKSIYYANDVAENWENGIIKTRKKLT